MPADRSGSVEDRHTVAIEVARRPPETGIDYAVETDIGHELARRDLVQTGKRYARVVIFKPVGSNEATVEPPHVESLGCRPFFPDAEF